MHSRSLSILTGHLVGDCDIAHIRAATLEMRTGQGWLLSRAVGV
jgi:hypothetical protein